MNGNRKEKMYLLRRKIRCRATSLFYHLLWVLPVNQRKIVFTAFEGDGGYCCNPRYIAEELLRQNNGYELVWMVNNRSREFPAGIRKVKNTFLNRAIQLTTAKIWVDNSRKAYGTAKRKNQFYIQTWHAALEFKPVGKFRGALFPRIAYLVSEYDSKMIDCLLSNSDWCTRLYPEMLLYKGKIIKTGSPRCDSFFNGREKIYHNIRERYSISEKAKIVMYAPTFRGGSQKGSRKIFVEEPTVDFAGMVQALEGRFGGDWFVFLRLHPQLAAQLEGVPIKNEAPNMVDVSQADDMNELLAASDALITDYSSSAFDAINMYLPVFLYADDLEEYIKERGQLMWDMSTLPFPVARTNEELRQRIIEFDERQYRERVDRFSAEQGVMEDGKASARVVDIIKEFIYKSERNRQDA